MAEYLVPDGISDADKRANYITLQVSQPSSLRGESLPYSVSRTYTDEFLSFSRSRDDSWKRERAVVFGDGVVAEVTADGAGAYPIALAISTPFVTSEDAAEELCERLLDFFDTSLDIKRITIEGDEGLWIGWGAALTDSWTGYDSHGMITSIVTTVDERGFRQEVSLDEKCGIIWGSGAEWLKVDDADNRPYNIVSLQTADDADNFY